jgi:hypothetical protein
VNSIELESYKMVFRLGAGRDVCSALHDLLTLESSVTEEVIDAVVAMIRGRDRELREAMRMAPARAFRFHIRELVAMTASKQLESAAREMGYFDEAAECGRVFINPDVDIYVNAGLQHPKLEQAAIDELYLWMERLVQKVKEYSCQPSHGPDERLRPQMIGSACVDAPILPIGKILQALEQHGSALSRTALRAMSYRFRPMINELRVQSGHKKMRPARSGERERVVKMWRLTGRPRWTDCERVLDSMDSIALSDSATEHNLEG